MDLNGKTTRVAARRVGLLFNHAEIVGGGEISFIDFAGALKGFDFEPVALVPGVGVVYDRLRAMGVEAHLMPLPAIRPGNAARIVGSYLRMARQFRELRLSLAHVNGARAMLYAGPAARRAGIPCLWHVRVLERDRLLDRLRGRYASAVIANSRAVASSLTPYLPAGKAAHVVYNGLDLNAWRDAASIDLGLLFKLPAGVPVVLAVGRLSRWKGFHDLIAACARLRAEGLEIACVLVGAPDRHDPGYADELRRQASAAGLSDTFVFAGWREDVPSLMKSAALLALPSHGEPFGRVVVEAWAAGLSVIATGAGGPAELIRDGEDGLLVPVGDVAALAASIRRLVGDSGLQTWLKTSGMARAGEFTLGAHAAGVVGIYKKVLFSNEKLKIEN